MRTTMRTTMRTNFTKGQVLRAAAIPKDAELPEFPGVVFGRHRGGWSFSRCVDYGPSGRRLYSLEYHVPADHTYLYNRDGWLTMKLHDTEVGRAKGDEAILNFGGYWSKTTMERMHCFLRIIGVDWVHFGVCNGQNYIYGADFEEIWPDVPNRLPLARLRQINRNTARADRAMRVIAHVWRDRVRENIDRPAVIPAGVANPFFGGRYHNYEADLSMPKLWLQALVREWYPDATKVKVFAPRHLPTQLARGWGR